MYCTSFLGHDQHLQLSIVLCVIFAHVWLSIFLVGFLFIGAYVVGLVFIFVLIALTVIVC
jgi:hypothetical protein